MNPKVELYKILINERLFLECCPSMQKLKYEEDIKLFKKLTRRIELLEELIDLYPGSCGI